MTPEDVRAAFDKHWPTLEKAVWTYGPTHTKSDVWERIVDGRAAFWTEGETAAVTTVESFPTGWREMHVWLCGGRLKEAQALDRRITAYAQKHEFDRLVFTGRRGWLRPLPAYREAGIVMVKDLKA